MNDHFRLIRQARATGVLFTLIVLAGLLVGGLAIWQSWLLAGAVNDVFLKGLTLADLGGTLRWILLVVVVRALFTMANEHLSGILSVRLKNELRELLLQKFDRLGPIPLKDEKSGELATTALQGLDALDAYFGQFLPQVLLAAMLPLTMLIVVFPIDPLTALVFLLTAPLIPIFMVLIGRLSKNHANRQWSELSRLGAFFLDTLQGLTTLLILGRSKDRAGDIKVKSERYRQVTMNVLRVTFLSAFVLELIATISTALVAVEIGLRLLYARMEFQQAFFILLIAPDFYLPLRNLSLRYHAGMNGLAAAGRIFQILDQRESPEVFNQGLIKGPDLKDPFRLTFDCVSYSYPDRQGHALQEISLTIESGKHYALVGETGSGKSTLVYMLLRFIHPTSGRLLLSEQEINGLDLEWWRRQIAWVPQNVKVFHTSFFENVRLNDPGYSSDAVWLALRSAGLEEKVKSLPDGLNTILQESGSNLSGGEARRLALARAYLRDAPILILDEPTASLDDELERSLTEMTRKLYKTRTTFTIAHRLSSVKYSDHVFVIQKGRLVEQGSHRELLSLKGEYGRLFQEARGSR